jgi:hypothetical protein
MLDFITVLERCEQIGVSFLGGKNSQPEAGKYNSCDESELEGKAEPHCQARDVHA